MQDVQTPSPDAIELRLMYDYDPETGIFRRLAAFRGHMHANAGHIDDRGYRKIWFQDKQHRAHRLAWLYMTGEWPPDEMDHEFGNKDDNRWEVIRTLSHRKNCLNQYRHREWSTYPGVNFRDRWNAWVIDPRRPDGTRARYYFFVRQLGFMPAYTAAVQKRMEIELQDAQYE